MTVIDHMNAPVSDMVTSKTFYAAVLGTLNLSILVDEAEVVGYGLGTWAFGIEIATGPIHPLHIAFAAPSEEIVKAFYVTGLAHGGTTNGAPGLRPEYGNGYFAAYVTDPDGHNIEAVFRG